MCITAGSIGVGLLFTAGALLAQPAAAQTSLREPIVKPLLSKLLVDLPGKEVTLLRVEYPPGGADPIHRHEAHGFIYVLEGEIVMGVEGGEPVTLREGDTFYEAPDDVHTIGRNASTTRPASFLVMLVKGAGADVLIPVE